MTAGSQKRDILEKSLSLKNALLLILIIALLIIAAGLNVLYFFPPNKPSADLENIELQSAQKNASENPNDAEALVRLGYVHFTMENYKDAIVWYKKAFDLEPQSPLIRYHLALGFLATEQYKNSIELLKPLAEEGVLNFDAHFTLGKAYYRIRNYEEAVLSLKKATVISPAAADAHYLLGLSYESLEEEEQALKSYSRALEMVPDYHEVEQAIHRISSKQ